MPRAQQLSLRRRISWTSFLLFLAALPAYLFLEFQTIWNPKMKDARDEASAHALIVVSALQNLPPKKWTSAEVKGIVTRFLKSGIEAITVTNSTSDVLAHYARPGELPPLTTLEEKSLIENALAEKGHRYEESRDNHYIRAYPIFSASQETGAALVLTEPRGAAVFSFDLSEAKSQALRARMSNF